MGMNWPKQGWEWQSPTLPDLELYWAEKLTGVSQVCASYCASSIVGLGATLPLRRLLVLSGTWWIQKYHSGTTAPEGTRKLSTEL